MVGTEEDLALTAQGEEQALEGAQLLKRVLECTP